MIAEYHQQNIREAVRQEAAFLGSLSAVARKAGCNEAVVTHWIFKQPSKVSDEMWGKIANAVGYDFNDSWHLADTNNTRIMHGMFADCQRGALWQIVAHKAGSGKSVSVKTYRKRYRDTGVYALECGTWGKKLFLLKLARELAMPLPDNAERLPINVLFERVVEFFRTKRAAGQRPILLLDQANSLSPKALMLLIHLFNEMDGKLSVVLLGTADLRKTIQRGVAADRPGYDELERRFGRAYTMLPGCSYADIMGICQANGLTDSAAILKIWAELPKQNTRDGERIIEVTHDLGRMKWLVEKYHLQTSHRQAA